MIFPGEVSVEVLAGRIKAFQQRRVGSAHSTRGRYAGGHGFLGLVVVTEHSGEAHAQDAPCTQRLHAVVRFAGARDMEANAAAGAAAGVLGGRAGLAAVAEHHHAVALVRLFDAPAQAFFGQQPRDEIEVGFAVLAVIAARAGIGHEGRCFVTPAPDGVRGMFLKHDVDDFHHRLVLPNAAVAHLAKAPQPRLQAQPVPRQAAKAAQHRRFAYQAVESGAGAVGQARLQCSQPAQQRLRTRHLCRSR